MYDIVFAGNDRKGFEKKAKQLGFKSILSVEDFGKDQGADIVLIDVTDVKELRKQIAKSKRKYKMIVVRGSTDEINRTSIESNQIDVLLSPEYSRRQDFMHYRNSGLNQVLCKAASKNNIAIGISLNEFKKVKDEKEKAMKLGRIMQNIRLCSKYKTKILLASFSETPEQMVSASDLKDFALAIGMGTKQAQESLKTAGRKA